MICLSRFGQVTPTGITYTLLPGFQLPSGLRSLGLTITYTAKGIEIKPDLANQVLVSPARITVQDSVIETTTAGGLQQSFDIYINYTGPTTFNLNYFIVRWYLALDDGRVVPDPAVDCKVSRKPLVDAVLPFPPTSSRDTTIVIQASYTPDGNKLCQVDFVVSCGCTNATITDYRIYCPDLESVICNPVQPLPELLQRYALARLMLSKLIFGCFAVKYLRQSYYPKFLRKIKACYPNWVDFFTGIEGEYPYRNYWQYFKA